MAAPFDPDRITTAAEARFAMRRGEWTGMTVHKLGGYLQCNLVMLPKADADDFLLYCRRNPAACPVIDVTDAGDPEPRQCAPGADLRTDLPRYAVYRGGDLVEEPIDVRHLWRDDLVCFLLGSSLTFDPLLERAGIPRTKPWVLDTTVPTVPAGIFAGPLVVTMRWLTAAQVAIATEISARLPLCHGAPIHVGDPSIIGADLEHPFSGPPVAEIPAGVVPVFWACGVTPQRVAMTAKLDFMITHASGHAFVCDLKPEDIGRGLNRR